jgi:DNA recombination protein Rad52
MAAERPDTTRPRRLSTAAKRRLRQPLAPEHVSERETGDGPVRYLEGWRAIQLANATFGEDRWGAEVVGEVTYRPIPQTGRRNATPVLGIYTATVRVTVEGCGAHSDVGAGVVDEQTADAHATAYKAAVTDGLKRALRRYGAGLGNDLSASLDGDDVPGPAVEVEPLRREVLAIAERAGSDEARTREWVAEKYGCPLDELDARRLQDAVTRLARGLDRRNGHAQAA